MKYLSFRAAADLLEIIRLSQFAGIATWTETMDRLLSLCAMSAQRNPTRELAERILAFNEWATDDNWSEEEITSPPAEPAGATRSHGSGSDVDDDDEYDFIHFHPGPNTGMARWEFRPFDADPYPSVPHGHFEGRDRPKLDPYLGWIYDRTKQVRRESKKNITALWNDGRFRRFALETIHFHLKHFTYHGDWRVANPARLPRRR